MECEDCGAEVPDESRFCLSCGRPIYQEHKPPVALPAKIPLDDSTETKSILLMAFAAMLIFFGIGFTPTLWWFVFIPLYALGALLLAIRYFIVRGYRKRVEAFQKKHIKEYTCEYCGRVNASGATKCFDCGAPLRARFLN